MRYFPCLIVQLVGITKRENRSRAQYVLSSFHFVSLSHQENTRDITWLNMVATAKYWPSAYNVRSMRPEQIFDRSPTFVKGPGKSQHGANLFANLAQILILLRYYLIAETFLYLCKKICTNILIFNKGDIVKVAWIWQVQTICSKNMIVFGGVNIIFSPTIPKES